MKRLRKRAVLEYEEMEEAAAVPTETTETNEELREAFEVVEQEEEVSKGDKEKTKEGEEEVRFLVERLLASFAVELIYFNLSDLNSVLLQEEILAEVIAESIELAKKQQEAQRTKPTTSELALLDDVEAEYSAAIPKPEVAYILSQFCLVSIVLSISIFLIGGS